MRRSESCAIAFYGTLVLILAVSTFFTRTGIYNSWWFTALWAIFGLLLVAGIIVGRLWRRPGVFVLHIGMVVTLSGAAITRLLGVEGTVTLAPGDNISAFVSNGEPMRLPFTVRLDSLEMVRHRGLDAPSDFVSHLVIDGSDRCRVSVNHPLSRDGYRFYQTSYLPGGGTVLTVSHDPSGIRTTYAGYLLMLCAGLWLMLSPSGRFRRLLRGAVPMVMLLLCCPATVSAHGAEYPDTVQVLYNGRIAPFGAVAAEFSTKLTGTLRPGGMDPSDLLRGIMRDPARWSCRRLIPVDDALRDALPGFEGEYASVRAFFSPDGHYLLGDLYRGTGRGTDRKVLEADERVMLFVDAAEGRLFAPLPPDMAPLSPLRIRMALLYARVPWGKISFIAAFAIGLLALLLMLVGRSASPVILPGIALLLWQLCAFVLRWSVAGHIPLGSGPETLVCLSLMILCGALPLLRSRRVEGVGVGALWLVAFVSLAAWLGDRNPAVTPLVPVLHSPWLSVHVSMMMAAYALLAFTLILALRALIRHKDAAAQRRLVQIILYPAIWLLLAGIITGAVWANQSWGRYWGWDPKETWALITLMVYVLPMHKAVAARLSDRGFALYIAVASLTVAMTYWGVNYLPSLHAYA